MTMRLPTSSTLWVLPALLLLALGAGPATAQGRLAFDAEVHDFGRLAEADAPQYTFRFTNVGDAPLRLARVEAACGCTTPSWTTDAVPPGGVGEVVVAFDPDGRAGPFEKGVLVVAGEGEPVTLRIRGTVVPAFAAGGAVMGALTFDRAEADVVTETGGGQAAFQYVNTGRRPLRVERVDGPEGVRVVFPERPVFPDHAAGLFAIIEPGAPTAFDLEVHTTDAEAPVKRLAVRLVPPRPRDGR